MKEIKARKTSKNKKKQQKESKNTSDSSQMESDGRILKKGVEKKKRR